MHYEGTVIRPPSEANSIILQVTVGCSHNCCTFCGAYKNVRFRIKSDAETDADLAFAARHCRRLTRVFLADGDVLILPQHRLLRLFDSIRQQLPQVRRISMYANGRAIRSKSDRDLAELKERGLDRIYLGLESGDNSVLQAVSKKETAETLAVAGRRIVAAEIFLSTTILLGLGGRGGSLEHAHRTAELLNAIRPNQIAALTLMPLDNTELGRQVAEGLFQLPEAPQMLREIRHLVEHISIDRVQFMANHASNHLLLSGRLQRDKKSLLEKIDRALAGHIPLVAEQHRAL